MAKELETVVKLQVPAGSANPAPPVGPALGQHGLNIQDFCKQFNDKTKDIEKGSATPQSNKVGKVTRQQIEEIVKQKEGDLNAAEMDQAVKIISGTARSMGIEVE